MKPVSKPVESVVIAGDGYAPLLIAISLKLKFKHLNLRLKILKTQNPDALGVEHAFSTMALFHKDIGLSENIFLSQVSAAKCLAIAFDGFASGVEGKDYFADSDYGRTCDGLSFSQWYYLFVGKLSAVRLDDFNLPAKLAHMMYASDKELIDPTIIDALTVGYVFDTGSYAAFLEKHASQLGIDVIDCSSEVKLLHDNGKLNSIELGAESIRAELFIDASAQQILTKDFDWIDDSIPGLSRADCKHEDDSPILGGRCTLIKNPSAGRVLRYKQTVLSQSFDVNDGQSAQVKLGRTKSAWVGNVIAMGAASLKLPGAIFDTNYFLQSQVFELCQNWPRMDDVSACSDVYNRAFQITCDRMQEIEVGVLSSMMGVGPFAGVASYEKFSERANLFDVCGSVKTLDHDVFSENLWAVLLWCLGRRPERGDVVGSTKSHAEIENMYGKQKIHLSKQKNSH